MKEDLNTLIVTVVVGQIAVLLAPEKGKRYLRLICTLVTLLALFRPIRYLADHAGDFTERFLGFLSAASETEVSEYDRYRAPALSILTLLREKWGIDSGETVTLVTDADGELLEVRILGGDALLGQAEAITETLSESLGVPVYVFRRTDEKNGSGKEAKDGEEESLPWAER